MGDEVVVHPGLSCRVCDMCTSGQEYFCRQFLIWGFQTGPNDGGHSELVTMPAANVLPKPANLTFEEAASMPLVLETAWRMLVTRAQIQAGENVLIWGGVGGLGVMAIQICRMFGANPIPVVGGAEKVALAQELGATDVIDRNDRGRRRSGQGADRRRSASMSSSSTPGEETWPTSMAALRWGGRIVVCGASTGFAAVTDLRFLWNKQQNLMGVHLSTKAELAAALKAVEAGNIKPVIDHVFAAERGRQGPAADGGPEGAGQAGVRAVEVHPGLTWLMASPRGREWLAELPGIVSRCVREWSLTDVGEPFPYAYASLALPVVTPDGMPAVLKAQFPDRDSRHEAAALAALDGRGAVRLIAHDEQHAALLVERCEPGTPLADLDRDDALDIACELFPRLWRPVADRSRCSPTKPRYGPSAISANWALAGRPIPAALLDAALDAIASLAGTPARGGARQPGSART